MADSTFDLFSPDPRCAVLRDFLAWLAEAHPDALARVRDGERWRIGMACLRSAARLVGGTDDA